MALTRHWYWVAIDRFPDARGALSLMELGKQLPFEVKRIYWIDGVPDREASRGHHAHAELSQVLFCASGSCDLELTTRDGVTELVSLSHTGDALFLDGQVWRVMRNFSPDCCLMVLADREFAKDTYIRDLAAFKAGG